MPSPAEVMDAAARLRAAIGEPYPGERAAAVIAAAACPDADTTGAIAQRLGWSQGLLSASLQALCAPLATVENLRAIAAKLRPRHELLGFVMPGNIPGAGLHELVLALLAGSAALVKTATAEPLFFSSFAARLAALDPQLGARLAVFNWSRARADLTGAVRQGCDRLIALGNDATIAQLSPARLSSADARVPDDCDARADFTGFGGRVSGVVLTSRACKTSASDRTARDVAFDVTLFEQRGCLSPHHVFIEDSGGDAARTFAARLAANLRTLSAGPLPPPSRLALEDAAAIRSIREQARWRAIGGRDVTLWEGPFPGWTVIYDRDAGFSASPGFRTVFVSPFASPADLARRLEPVKGRVEAFAFKHDPATDEPGHVVPIRAVLEQVGATYICEPGRMQSPPIDWPHGGGGFIRMLMGER